jgi:hypothetical protein
MAAAIDPDMAVVRRFIACGDREREERNGG